MSFITEEETVIKARHESLKYLVLPESALTYNPGRQPELQLVGINGPV